LTLIIPSERLFELYNPIDFELNIIHLFLVIAWDYIKKHIA
jgi:hypothetical protein